MFRFTKARSPAETLSDLENFLRGNSDEPIEFLARTVDDWRKISYEDLEAAIAAGKLDELIDWQSRYAAVVNEKLSPLWLAAMQTAALKATLGRITIDDSDFRVKDFLRTRGAELVTSLSDESKRAIAAIILHGQANMIPPKKIAQQIRPLIGLNARQAQANANYRERIFNRLVEQGLPANAANSRADKAALKYASKQHRQRAETIVHTELARAYNQGAHEGILAAQRAGLMGVCEMVWSTAGTNRVCGRCLALKDTVVGHTNESGVTLPPLHPRCRCTIIYREVGKPLTSKPPRANVGSTTDALAAPKNPLTVPALTSSPQIVTACKTFDELKMYWADNYNVKISDAIGKLHFESVREAMTGVETVLKKFPPAMRYLKEFALLDKDIMTNERGKGIINFNPEYFSDKQKLLSVLTHGALTRYYHKNMNPFSVGAHEAGHIIEVWLLEKYGVGNISLQILSLKIIREAYRQARQTTEGNGKTITLLKSEIAIHALKEKPSECLADAVSDYITNGINAALLSREIWAVLQEELS